MQKSALLFLALIALAVTAGCGGSEPPAPAAGESDKSAGHEQIPAVGQLTVDVPDEVRGHWKGVVLVALDKERNEAQEYIVPLGGTFKLPESDLTVELWEFFPAFVMQGSVITSTSNEPNNPAAQVVVMEGGEEIFKGWLFARYPTTHAFTHPRFMLTLKEGVPEG